MRRLRRTAGFSCWLLAGLAPLLWNGTAATASVPLVLWGGVLLLDERIERLERRSPLLARPRRLATWSAASLLAGALSGLLGLAAQPEWPPLEAVAGAGGAPVLARWIGSAAALPLVLLLERYLQARGVFARTDAVGYRRPLRLPRFLDPVLYVAGAACLSVAALLASPNAAWPWCLVWLGVCVGLEPVQRRAGRPSLLRDWCAGVCGPTLRLLLAGAGSGLLWVVASRAGLRPGAPPLPAAGELDALGALVVVACVFPAFALACVPFRAATEAARDRLMTE